MAKSLFEAIGYMLGQKAAQAKNVFDLLSGTEEESLRAEIHLGHDLAASLAERMPLIEENETTRFVAEIGHWLAASVKKKKLPFSVRVTAEQVPNAFALPGGPMFVSWPLLALCQGQRDAIAFVLGHEMAHIVLRHAVDRLIRDSILSLLLRQCPAKHALSAWLRRGGRQALTRAYSRENELAADSYAVTLIQDCGGDALAGEQLLEKLAQRMPTQSATLLGEYFATHPPVTERLAHLRSRRSGCRDV